MKQSLEKQPISKRDTTLKPDFTGVQFPPHIGQVAVRVEGIQWLKWLHKSGANNLTEGTNKNELEVKERALSK